MWERSIGSLISHVFEGRTATGSGPFSLLIQYALTLPILYCYVSLLLRRRFAQKFVETHGPRVQKDNFPFTCVVQKKINSLLEREMETVPVDVLFKIHVSLASHFTYLFIYLFNPRNPNITIQFLICCPYRFPMKVVETSC